MKSVSLSDRWLGIEDVKAITGIKSYTTLLKYMDDEKKLPFFKVGKHRKFTLEDIKRFQDNCRTPALPNSTPS